MKEIRSSNSSRNGFTNPAKFSEAVKVRVKARASAKKRRISEIDRRTWTSRDATAGSPPPGSSLHRQKTEQRRIKRCIRFSLSRGVRSDPIRRFLQALAKCLRSRLPSGRRLFCFYKYERKAPFGAFLVVGHQIGHQDQ